MKAGRRWAKQVEMVEEVLKGGKPLLAKLLQMLEMGVGGVLEVQKMVGVLEGDLLLALFSLHFFCLAPAALGEYSLSFNLVECNLSL